MRNTFRNLCLVCSLVLLASCSAGEADTKVDTKVDSKVNSVKDIIEGGSATGKDISGQTRTCKPMGPGRMCTMEFTKSDEFANECREKGAQAVQCGCHDWICIE